jgi:hypothetical protein
MPHTEKQLLVDAYTTDTGMVSYLRLHSDVTPLKVPLGFKNTANATMLGLIPGNTGSHGDAMRPFSAGPPPGKQSCVVLCCAVLCCVVLYCVVLCCVVLCCVVLCCAVLW